jgi:hypothetical protein
VLAVCGPWLDSLSPSQRPSGIVSGRVLAYIGYGRGVVFRAVKVKAPAVTVLAGLATATATAAGTTATAAGASPARPGCWYPGRCGAGCVRRHDQCGHGQAVTVAAGRAETPPAA